MDLYIDKAGEEFFEASEVSDLEDSDIEQTLVIKPDIHVEVESDRNFPDT
jgi:hypothetical protein